MRIGLRATTLTLLFLATPMNATDAPHFTPRGYLQLNGIFSSGDSEFPEGFRLESTGGGVAFAVGSRLSPWYAVEMEVQWSKIGGKFISNEVLHGASISSKHDLEADQTSFILNGKIYPFTSWNFPIQPYAKIGVGMLAVDGSVHSSFEVCVFSTGECTFVDDHNGDNNFGVGMRFGGGAELMMDENIYFYLDYSYTKSVTGQSDRDNWHSVGAGIGYLF